jgi:predicted ATP-grasp superfamily ATP-dependent carboligase
VLILVTDGEERAALAACRGLSRAGHDVAVAAGMRGAPTHASRACAARLLLPRSIGLEEFATALVTAVGRTSYDALLPATDAALLAVSLARERLPASLVSWLPPDETVAQAMRKHALVEAACAAGFAGIASRECVDREQAHEAAVTFGFPVVVKPAMSVVISGAATRRVAARVVHDDAQLAAALPTFGTPVLIQRFHSRTSVLSLGGVAWNGRVVALVAARWSRRWPPVDGAASFAETVPPPPPLADQAESLVAALGWQGIFELELLELEEGGYAALDFNPRPFGWMTLSLRAGANLPAIWADCVRGLDGRRVVARAGVRYRWEEGDALHLLWQLRRGRARAAAAVLRPHRRVAHAYFELRDPRPLGAALADLSRRARRRLLTRRE